MAFFTDVGVDSVAQLVRWARKHDPLSNSGNWVFRGQSASGTLLSTFDRACKSHSIRARDRSELEQILVREFARKAYLYLPASELPDPGDTLEWLSLMQHHGAPTRLLDWTYSLMVAVHFALAGQPDRSYRYVFAIDANWVNKRAMDLKPGLEKWAEGDADKGGSHFRKHFLDGKSLFVSTENPYRINRRLALQRGLFLCAGNVRADFERNLEALGPSHGRAIRLKLSRKSWPDLYDELYRLNIDSEVLFPGIDGLARAIGFRAATLGRLVQRARADISRLGRAPD